MWGECWAKAFLSFLPFLVCVFKGLEASCSVSLEHMKGSMYFPHTVAPSLRPQDCKILESKHQRIRDRMFQMAGPALVEPAPPDVGTFPEWLSAVSGNLLLPLPQMSPRESNKSKEGPGDPSEDTHVGAWGGGSSPSSPI